MSESGPPPAPPPCAHSTRVEGVCTACGDCVHEVILNGACFLCGTTDLDPVALSPKKPSPLIPPEHLARRKG